MIDSLRLFLYVFNYIAWNRVNIEQVMCCAVRLVRRKATTTFTWTNLCVVFLTCFYSYNGWCRCITWTSRSPSPPTRTLRTRSSISSINQPLTSGGWRYRTYRSRTKVSIYAGYNYTTSSSPTSAEWSKLYVSFIPSLNINSSIVWLPPPL